MILRNCLRGGESFVSLGLPVNLRIAFECEKPLRVGSKLAFSSVFT